MAMNDETGSGENEQDMLLEAANNEDHHNDAGQDDNVDEPPAAAAGAASARARPAERSLLEQLMERIRTFLEGVGAEPGAEIDEEQARRLLEASAGDLDVVTSLYCDHYFATLGSRRNARRPAEQDEEESPRRVRRRLEEELDQHADENPQGDEMQEHEQDIEENDANPPAEDDVGDPDEMPPPDQPENRRAGVEARIAALDRAEADDNNNEGHAVSDDEGPSRPSRHSRRRVRIQRHEEPNIAAAAPILRNISENMEHGEEYGVQQGEDDTAPLQRNQPSVKKEDDECDCEDDVDDEFLSDTDWIFRSDSDPLPVNTPEILLWGDLLRPDESAPDDDGNAANAVAAEEASNAPPIAERAGNIVAEDDDDDGDDVPSSTSQKEGIPKTWIHAGFSASSCGTGLVTKPPDDDENSIYRWRQSQNSGLRNIAPPPYHCRGITALLSIVTALIYSGASIQGSGVDCKKARTPFAELPESDRKREFDSRLVDALSSLLMVASKASLERKKRALTKRTLTSPAGSGDDDKLRQQNLERRLRLIPTCRFEDDAGTGDACFPEGEPVQIATSFTSIEDIRSYVMSTLRMFKKKGGCALFLESIIRIHGVACVERMMRCSRRKARLPSIDVLIECECEKRQKKLQELPFPATGTLSETGKESSGQDDEALPLDHCCISIELVSLLLTGNVHSDFRGWDTGSLGIGILSTSAGEVGRQLMRPEKPVWVLRGDTCYTVLWLDGSNHENAKSISRGDHAAADMFRLSHWNAWFGNRHKSGMRVITARGEWTAPIFSKVRSNGHSDRRTVSEAIMARRREQSNIVSSDEHVEDDKVNSVQCLTKEDIDKVRIHPEDRKLFPDNYRQWRFDIGNSVSSPDGKLKAEDNVKIGAVSGCAKEHWTPYFRLDERQQMLVEMKVSPMIKRILWTRWPGATIDRFTPEDATLTPPVV